MPAEGDRSVSCCIWFTSCFFFLILLVGGALLVLYIALPDSPDTDWLPVAGMALVAIPWLFWILMCVYRYITRPKDDIERPPMRAAAVAPATGSGATYTNNAASAARREAAAAPAAGAGGGDSSLASHESEVPLALSM
ncbi:hypothetical protein Cni_G11075 [Canna indica]|uniref:Uncharacterized protein n=1 Tax=Canna indica TaxID=4628 RepID=A0AAQ3QAH5_9LILI|nr:hypothetical protein Cni_G11075 [Canna indica]